MLWIERTPPEFTFNIKAYSLLTNHPTERVDLQGPPAAASGRQAAGLSRQAPRRGRGGGLGALPRRTHAAALRRQARGGPVPVPAVVRHLEEEQGVHRGVRRPAAGLPRGGRVPAQELDGGTQCRGDALVPGGAQPAVRVRGHAARFRFSIPPVAAATAKDLAWCASTDGAGGVGNQARDGQRTVPLRLREERAQEWVPQDRRPRRNRLGRPTF